MHTSHHIGADTSVARDKQNYPGYENTLAQDEYAYSLHPITATLYEEPCRISVVSQ
jgi:hypothetical protein